MRHISRYFWQFSPHVKEDNDLVIWRNVWSMKWRVPGQEVDQRKLGERLWKKDCQACGLNREDVMDRIRWMKQIRDDWWPRWVWVGECFFWYRLTRVFPDKIQSAVKRLCVCVCVVCVTLLAQYMLWCNVCLSVCLSVSLSVCLSVCLSQAGILLKRLTGQTYFRHKVYPYCHHIWYDTTQY